MGKASARGGVSGYRVTYRSPEEFRYREAWWASDRGVSAAQWRALEVPLGRSLTLPERARIAAILNGCLADVATVRPVPRLSQMQTLQALSKLAPGEAARAFARIDGWTEAEMCAALRFDPGFSEEDRRGWIEPRPELVPVVAARALERLKAKPPERAGPKVKHYRRTAVAFAVEFWLVSLQQPRSSRRPRGEGGGTGRLCEWAAAFLALLDPEPNPREVGRMVADHLRRRGGN